MKRIAKNRLALKFIALTFIWSWSLWFIVIESGLDTFLGKVIFAIAAIGPSSIGIILAYTEKNHDYRECFWKRITSFRQISIRSYLIIFLVIPGCNFFALLLNYWHTGVFPEMPLLKLYIENPIKVMPFIMYMLIFGPFVEEIGWRGFALDHLQSLYGWFPSSILLGFCWGLWHLPLFFIEGTYQYTLYKDSILYTIIFMAELFPESIIMGWLYNQNTKSILSGVLFHFSINFFSEIINVPNSIKIYRTLGLILIALIITSKRNLFFFLHIIKNKSFKH